MTTKDSLKQKKITKILVAVAAVIVAALVAVAVWLGTRNPDKPQGGTEDTSQTEGTEGTEGTQEIQGTEDKANKQENAIDPEDYEKEIFLGQSVATKYRIRRLLLESYVGQNEEIAELMTYDVLEDRAYIVALIEKADGSSYYRLFTYLYETTEIQSVTLQIPEFEGTDGYLTAFVVGDDGNIYCVKTEDDAVVWSNYADNCSIVGWNPKGQLISEVKLKSPEKENLGNEIISFVGVGKDGTYYSIVSASDRAIVAHTSANGKDTRVVESKQVGEYYNRWANQDGTIAWVFFEGHLKDGYDLYYMTYSMETKKFSEKIRINDTVGQNICGLSAKEFLVSKDGMVYSYHPNTNKVKSVLDFREVGEKTQKVVALGTNMFFVANYVQENQTEHFEGMYVYTREEVANSILDGSIVASDADWRELPWMDETLEKWIEENILGNVASWYEDYNGATWQYFYGPLELGLAEREDIRFDEIDYEGQTPKRPNVDHYNVDGYKHTGGSRKGCEFLYRVGENVWLIPYISGYYTYEGVDGVTMEEALKSVLPNEDGMIPYNRGKSPENYAYIVMLHDGVWRYQKLVDMMDPSPKTSARMPKDATALDKETLNWFETEFFNIPDNKMANAFIGYDIYYEKPEDIPLYYIFYDGILGKESARVTEDEEKLLKSKDAGDVKGNIYKVTKEEMNEVLLKYAGISFEESNKLELDKFIYLEAYDAYYSVHEDTRITEYKVLEGWVNTDGIVTVRLRRPGTRYQFYVTFRYENGQYYFNSQVIEH